MRAKRIVAFDTETNGLYRWQGSRPFCFSTCDGAGKSEAHRLDKPGALRRMKMLWADTAIDLVGHNMKFDLGMSVCAGARPPYRRRIHDTSIMSHLLQNDHPSHRLKELAWELGNYPRDDEARMKSAARGHGMDYSQVPWEVCQEYAANDAERTMLLYQLWMPVIRADPKTMRLYDMECDLLWTTYRLEERGIPVRLSELDKLQRDMERQVKSDAELMTRTWGKGFNPNKPDMVADMLFRKLNLPMLSETRHGNPSTDKRDLMELARRFPDNRVVPAVLRYRSYSRGRTTFQQYRELLDDDGRLHPNINTCGASTGRESSEHPNLQNISKSKVLLNPYPVPARRVFMPAMGYVNYHIDYAGQEMRLMVSLCKDPNMLKCFLDDGDPHAYSARMFYGAAFDNTDEDRRKILRTSAKNAAFARCYGANIRTIAATLGLSIQDARIGCARWDSEFPVLAALCTDSAQFAAQRGYVETLLGRRTHVADSERSYVGLNYQIQGTGADIIKFAQNRVDRFLHDHTGDEVGLLLPVHDELILQYPRKRLPDSRDLLRKIGILMTDFSEFAVPMQIEVKVSTYSWDSLKGVSLQ